MVISINCLLICNLIHLLFIITEMIISEVEINLESVSTLGTIIVCIAIVHKLSVFV